MVNQSLRTRLLLLIGVVFLFAIGAILKSLWDGTQALNVGKNEIAKNAAESMLDKLDRNLFERYGDVQAFALSDPARSLNRTRINDFMVDMMQAYAPIYDVMIVTDAHGNVVAANTIDKNGKPIDTRELLEKNYSNAEWFKKAMSNNIKAGTAFVEDLHVDAEVAKAVKTDGRVMSFTAAIRDKATGAVIGVWSNRVSWNDVVVGIVREEIEKLKSGRLANFFPLLTSQDGTYLVHPEGAKTELNGKHEFENEHVTSAKSTTQVSKNLKTSFFDGDVVETIASSRGYSIYPGIGWTMIAYVPVEDAETISNRRMGIVMSLIMLGVGVFAFIYLTKIATSIIKVSGSLSVKSTKIASIASDVEGAAQSLSSTTTEQSAAITETAASMEEMASMIAKTYESSKLSLEVVDRVRTEADQGNIVVSQMSAAMETIDASTKQLETIVNLMRDIEQKTKVINDIVFETRLLSFNASIEAARAGVHGKGFAVVAEEVGKLALMSGKAAAEIKTLLETSNHEVVTSVKMLQDNVASSRSVVDHCKESFGTVHRLIEELRGSVSQIVTANHEQSEGVKQVNAAMVEMDGVTQSNSTNSEQLTTYAAQMDAESKDLAGAVQNLDRVVAGRSTMAEKPTKHAHSLEKGSPKKLPDVGEVRGQRRPASKNAA